MAKTSQRQTAAPTRVGIISLGCAKNLVDAEVMLGSLMADGLEITHDPAEADALMRVVLHVRIENAQRHRRDQLHADEFIQNQV